MNFQVGEPGSPSTIVHCLTPFRAKQNQAVRAETCWISRQAAVVRCLLLSVCLSWGSRVGRWRAWVVGGWLVDVDVGGGGGGGGGFGGCLVWFGGDKASQGDKKK